MIEIFAGFALFASAITSNKLLLSQLSPTFFVALRMLCAGSLIFLINWIRHGVHVPKITKYIFPIFLIGALTTFIPSILKAYALKNMISSKTALIGSLDPFVTAIYAYFLWAERLSIKKIIGMIIGFSGIAILLISTSPLEEFLGSWMFISLPELAAFVSMVISRYGWIRARDILKQEQFSPSELNSFIMLIGGTYALISAYFSGTCDWCSIPTTFSFWGLFGYTVIVGNIAGYTIYAYLLKKHNMTLVSFCGLSVSLFVHLYGPLILGESLSSIFFISLAVVAFGMYLFYYDEFHPQPTSLSK